MSQIDKITKDLSLRVQQAVPSPQLGRNVKPLTEQQIQRRLERFYQDAGAVRAQEKLGIFRWARVMLGLREQLLRAGYPPTMVSPLIRSTLFQSARPDLTAAQPSSLAVVPEPELPGGLDKRGAAQANRQVSLDKVRELMQQGKKQRALAMVKTVLARDPRNYEALLLLSDVLVEMNSDEEAIDALERARAIRPDEAEAHKRLGLVLVKTGEWRRARDVFEVALRLRPDDAHAHHRYAMTFVSSFEMDRVITSTDEAIRLDPKEPRFHILRGFALQELGRFDESVQAFSSAEKLEPGYPAALWNLSLQMLLRGNFKEGWRLYEARRKSFPWFIEGQFKDTPEWTGESDLSGKSIILTGEQGLGDVIQFARYAPLVKARGGHVTLYVDRVLLPVLTGIEGADEVMAYDVDTPPKADFWVPLMSLPGIFGTTAQDVPSPGPYIRANPEKTEAWSKKLGPASRPRVGLVWSGNPTHPKDLFRTIPLEDLVRHLPSGLEYFGLQKDVRLADKEWLQGSGIRFLGNELRDFGDTAAACQLMDVVVTVDTSVAHLAAAMGRPTWVLLPLVPDWRWLLERDDSPWYRSIRLLRQGADRQWAPVLERVGRDLKARFA